MKNIEEITFSITIIFKLIFRKTRKKLKIIVHQFVSLSYLIHVETTASSATQYKTFKMDTISQNTSCPLLMCKLWKNDDVPSFDVFLT